MAAIILPDRRKRQPKGVVEIDRGNSLATGLVFAKLPNRVVTYDKYGNPVGLISATTSNATDSDSLVRGHVVNGFYRTPTGGTSANGVYLSVGKEPATWSSDMEMIFLADTYSNVRGYWFSHNSSAMYSNGLLPSQGTTVFHDVSYDCTTSSPTCSVGADFAYASLTKTGTFPWNTGASSRTVSVGSDALGIYASYLYVFDRTLCQGALRTLSDNPWQIFKKKKQVIYSFPSFPVLSSISVSNITSSGGRLTAST